MKIIENNAATKCTCRFCRSILEVLPKDIFTEYIEYGGALYNNDYFICPCCFEKNILDDERTLEK